MKPDSNGYSRSKDPRRWPDWQLEAEVKEQVRHVLAGQEAAGRLHELVSESTRRAVSAPNAPPAR